MANHTAPIQRVPLCLALGLLACNPDPTAAPMPDGGTPAGTTLDYLNSNRLDLLFLIDNSGNGQILFQKALFESIPMLFRKLDQMDVSYHIGIATSDVGTWVAPGVPFGIRAGTCNTFEGDDGVLQRVPCTVRNNTSTDARDLCTSLCTDPSFVPQAGQGFIAKEGGVTNVPKAMVKDPKTGEMVDIGPQRTFQCIAQVGDVGCGLEAHLEGAQRALDGHRAENQGFLRPDSVLAVLFVADEDDCSASPAGRKEYDPVSSDCPVPDKEAPFLCFNADYRCVARNIICDQPLNAPGAKTNCRARDKSFLEPISTYARFFQGLHPASKLLIDGIWTPSLDKGGKVMSVYSSILKRSDDLHWGDQTDAACFNADNPVIFAQPQIRLSTFAAQFPDKLESNVCDVVSYPNFLEGLADAIKGKLKASCVSAVPRLKAGLPLCVVGDVDEKTPEAVPAVVFPVCSAPCCQAFANSDAPSPADPAVARACMGEGTDACFCALPSTRPDVCSGAAVAGMWRKGGAGTPRGKLTSFRCSR